MESPIKEQACDTKLDEELSASLTDILTNVGEFGQDASWKFGQVDSEETTLGDKTYGNRRFKVHGPKTS